MKQEAKHIQDKKHPYTPPELTVYGNVEDITQALGGGPLVDVDFPRDFPPHAS